ncbi:MAG TPA: ABC transporter permease [Opitutaceae bacterium]|jgi:oligopeptide transport system permease protein
MLRFIGRRLLEAIPVMIIIITATFFVLRLLPGGPFTQEKAVTPEVKRNLEAYYHLDEPLWKQYVEYVTALMPKRIAPAHLFGDNFDLKAAFGIDFGPSYRYPNRTVNEIIAEKLPISLELGVESLVIALAIGIPLGVLAAVFRNSWLDYVGSSVSMLGICVPTFVLGPLMVLLFAIHLRWFDASGWFGPSDRVLPAITLGVVYAAYIARMSRAGMLEILDQDFIRTARAKGASEFRVVVRHALRGGMVPVVSFLGPAIASLMTGSFIIETIFQIPGLGREFVNAGFNRDRTLLIGTVILYAGLIIVLNLVVDIVLAAMNPRISREGTVK